jgi:hypothetical protein
MSDPQWREVRPSRQYGGDPGDRPRRRDTRGSDPRLRSGPPDDAATRRMLAQTGLTQPIAPPLNAAQPGAPQPTFTPTPTPTPRPGEASGRAVNGPATPRGRGAGNRPRARGGRLSRIWEGSLRGGLGVCVIVGSAMIGAIATIVTKSQPGSVLGLSVLAGTVAAALTVQPRTGRLIFPVPAISYLIAALGAGVVYDRSADKTQIAVGAAQWVASGFFVMVLSTLLAIALTTVRWFMWRRDQQGPVPPEWSDPGRTAPRPQPGPSRPPGTRPGTPPSPQPTQWRPGPQGTGGWDQRPRPRPDPGPGRAPDQRPRPRPLQLLQRGVAQHQVLDPVVGPEVDLGLGLVAVAVHFHDPAEPVLVVRDQVVR